MIKKVLIANRGEIAVRIIRACRELGIQTVTVYSTADRHALHAKIADESVCIGPPATKDSYLNAAALIEACKMTGADAIHPGFGFLSENADFADLCKENGIALVLIKAPTEFPHWYDEWDEQVRAFAEENDVEYINYIPLQEEIGLDMSQDTYDAGLHLNTQGAEKMAKYFGQYLVDNYDLTDYRNDASYAKIWQEKVDFYNSMKQQQYAELEQYGELVSFGANAIED